MFKKASDKFPTLNHILTLAGIVCPHRHGPFWNIKRVTRMPALSELVKRNLVAADRSTTDTEVYYYTPTPEGGRVLSQIDPVEIVQTVSEYSESEPLSVTPLGATGLAYFIGKLPLEYLPEFLVSPLLLFQIAAEERLRELEDVISQGS